MKTLIVILGPTAVGKTGLSIEIAKRYNAPILSADSRQIYKGMGIGTAAPTDEELGMVKHYFVGELELTDYYSAALYEENFLRLSEELFKTNDTLIMCGGSMMYIDAVCYGIDEIPTVSDEVRSAVMRDFAEHGLEAMCCELRMRDPELAEKIDLKNHKRVIHAIEICRMTGTPFSTLRTNTKKMRPFNILKIGLTRPREELFSSISKRTDKMIAAGFESEARMLYPLRNLNALNTVGYKEMFAYIDGVYSLDEAVEKIKRNTRVYAKKQITWFKRDKRIHWFSPYDKDDVFIYIDSCMPK
ncbi:MAG: tRNA (adenosine(37)-N6)-dimethylallyltransferase MiaA [Bacteroidales bacterium]